MVRSAGTQGNSGERKLAVFRTVLDGFGLPFRQPVLFMPFFVIGLVSFVVLVITFFGALVGGGLGALFNLSGLLESMSVMVLLGLLAVAVLLELGTEATSGLAARAELGRDAELGAAFGQAVRRLPAFFVATLPLLAASYLLSSLLTVLSDMGMPQEITMALLVLLAILSIFLWIRFMLVPVAIVVGNAGPLEAFKVSWQLSQGSWWRLFFLLLVAFLGMTALFFVLILIPIVGWFAAGWLGFAGMTTVLTLAYVRLGGRVAEA
jgi:hypothetical protein